MSKHITDLRGEIDHLRESAPTIIAEKVKDVMLDNFSIDGVHPVTKEDIVTMMNDMQNKIVDSIRSMPGSREPEAPTPQHDPGYQISGGTLGEDGWRWWLWGNRIHMVPKGWHIDKSINTSNLFNLWVCGNSREKAHA